MKERNSCFNYVESCNKIRMIFLVLLIFSIILNISCQRECRLENQLQMLCKNSRGYFLPTKGCRDKYMIKLEANVLFEPKVWCIDICLRTEHCKAVYFDSTLRTPDCYILKNTTDEILKRQSTGHEEFCIEGPLTTDHFQCDIVISDGKLPGSSFNSKLNCFYCLQILPV